MLTNITIEELLGVGRVELGFVSGPRVYTLFGENGIGKTKCLEALYQFLVMFNKDFQEHFVRFNSGTFANKPILRNEEDGVSFEHHGEVSFKSLKVSGKKSDEFPHQLPVVFLGASRRASLMKTDQNTVSQSLASFEKRQTAYFSLLLSALISGNLSSLGMSDDTRTWFVERAKANNPNNKNKSKWKAETDAVLSMLHTIEPFIDPEGFQADNGEKIGFVTDDDDGVFLRLDGQERELGELSSGFAALVKIAQALIEGYAAFTDVKDEKALCEIHGIVFIDEIDAHLHPSWQARIIPCLKTLLPNTKFYIATHSPMVLSQLLDGEAYLLKHDDDSVVRSKPIRYPNRRLFADVLEDGTGVDLNKLKLASMENDDHTEAKQKLLSLLESLSTQGEGEA